MRLKSSILTITVIVSFLFAGTTIIRAQGFFSEKKNDIENSSQEAANPDDGGILAKAPPGGWGGGDDDDPDAPGEDDITPVGEGFLILSLLAGGYALVKRKVRKKYEN